MTTATVANRPPAGSLPCRPAQATRLLPGRLSLARALLGTTVALLTTLLLVAAVAAPAHADPPAPERAPADTPAHAADGFPAEFLPEPSPDPWYSAPAPDDSVAPGTVLETRPVTLPEGMLWPAHRAWQVRVASRDAHERPMSIVSTVIVPESPAPGGAPRPLVSLDGAVDSLGTRCAGSWRLAHEFQLELPPVTGDMLARGWALVVTDHEGPRMAYAAGRLAGHAVLDGVRAARSLPGAGLGDSPVALNGYSGGAIASGWAAQLQPAYAPDLGTALVGVVAGGTPADPALLFDSMDSTLGSGLFRAAILGMAREYPELLQVFDERGRAMASSPLKDVCQEAATVSGLVPVPVRWLSTDPDPRSNPMVREVLAANRMGESAPNAPVLLVHGSASVAVGDEFIPEAGALRLRDEWCSRGGRVQYLPVAGEHLTAPFTAKEPSLAWLAARFAGEPLGPTCGAAA